MRIKINLLLSSNMLMLVNVCVHIVRHLNVRTTPSVYSHCSTWNCLLHFLIYRSIVNVGCTAIGRHTGSLRPFYYRRRGIDRIHLKLRCYSHMTLSWLRVTHACREPPCSFWPVYFQWVFNQSNSFTFSTQNCCSTGIVLFFIVVFKMQTIVEESSRVTLLPFIGARTILKLYPCCDRQTISLYIVIILRCIVGGAKVLRI